MKDEKSLETILKATEEVRTFFKGIRKIFLILLSLVVLLFVLLIISTTYNTKLENLNSELENQKIDSIIKTIMDIKRVQKNDSTITTSYSYQVRGDKIVTYNELVNEKDSLRNTIDSLKLLRIKLKSKNSELDQKLKMIIDNYGIKFTEFYKIKNKDTINYLRLEGKKIDSALILLEHYRKNLSYDKEKNKWYIIENK
ncbi:hypothetical protein ZPR_1308 [Zunongwangia profunda SM-A87]|uniref:Uncharacterized protein n=1 Tax=Zunongwangia profunda (strain DSM 18752 / CCTCC AB 206139 / SM-A87) TaxID=655815 RepID=D5BJH8_ZUNPS|nr:hypothetical protein ZPR_1308 [Zunongwangia profunda SM-A87]